MIEMPDDPVSQKQVQRLEDRVKENIQWIDFSFFDIVPDLPA
jgi:hypothetical protein